MSHEFELRREVVLPATPEQVFAAVTTGTAGWLFPLRMEPGAGGAAPPDPGVADWDPPHRFAVRQEGEAGWFNALEFVIEARAGGTAVLRYVHSGIFADDWETQYDATGKHTDFYLHSLGEYLRYFPGRTATYVAAQGPAVSAAEESLTAVKDALGLPGAAGAGTPVRFEVPGLAPQEAVVDYINPYFLGLRADEALYRFYGRNAFGGTVDLAHHLFAPDADGETARRAWGAWLNGAFDHDKER